MTMKGTHFVELARWAYAYHYDVATARIRGKYEDEFVEIDTNEFVNTDMLLEISRKELDPCPKSHSHLRVSNPTTMVYPAREGEEGDETIIRHHGEHLYVVNHIMWLVSQSDNTEALAFLEEMRAEYPDHYPEQGYDLR